MSTEDAHSSGHIAPSYVGLAYVQIVKTNPYPNFVVFLPDYALRTSISTFSIFILNSFLVRPFDYTAFAVNWNIGIPWTGFTSPVWWLLLLQLTVFSRSATAVYSNILVAFLCFHVPFCFFLFSIGVRSFLSYDLVRYLPFSLVK